MYPFFRLLLFIVAEIRFFHIFFVNIAIYKKTPRENSRDAFTEVCMLKISLGPR